MNTISTIDYQKLNQSLTKMIPEKRLQAITEIFPRVAFATSFGKEDQMITDMIVKLGLDIDFFTLDTGRLFKETYQTWQKTIEQYKIKIKVFYPKAHELSQFVELKGPNSFYDSVKNRIECCRIRKISGLTDALKDYDCWVVGLRSAQSSNRAQMPILAEDHPFQLAKLSALMDVSDDEVDIYVKENKLPINPLHQKGFVSIGCEPCTRAVKKGEDFRAGRWWWEESSKECGLHQSH